LWQTYKPQYNVVGIHDLSSNWRSRGELLHPAYSLPEAATAPT
jgi:hypothetical protein